MDTELTTLPIPEPPAMLVALSPGEMPAAQASLIAWLDQKLGSLRGELWEVVENLEIAKKAKWKHSAWESQERRCRQRIRYLENERDEARADRDRLTAERDALRRRLDEVLADDVERLRANWNEALAEADALRQRVAELEATEEKNTIALTAYKSAVDELSAERDAAEQRCERLREIVATYHPDTRPIPRHASEEARTEIHAERRGEEIAAHEILQRIDAALKESEG